MPDPFKTEGKDRVQHVVSDTDLNWVSPHHTLGRGPTQAAPGNHTHEDLNEKLAELEARIAALEP